MAAQHKPTSADSSHTNGSPANMQLFNPQRQHSSTAASKSNDTAAINMPSNYKGSGTEQDPYVVTFSDGDSDNPYNWSHHHRLMLTFATSIATLVVSFDSSCYTGPAAGLMTWFGINEEILTLGVSLYVLGFAIGPLLWAPLSEMYGRRAVFAATYLPFIVWLAACIGSPNITALLFFRFLAGIFSSSMLTNSGAVIGDMFNGPERGKPIALFAAAVFCGPVLGPIVGGFIGEYGYGSGLQSWQWTFIVMSIFPAVVFIACMIGVPETYGPVILRWRAQKLMEQNPGSIYKTEQQVKEGDESVADKLKVALIRPWQLLFLEPIVLLLSIWIAIVYGTLYLCFEAFPISFQQQRGWTSGIGGLAFLGIGAGMLVGVALNLYIFDPQYVKVDTQSKAEGRKTPPEARLPMACIGGLLCPVSLLCFAWTTYPWIHWSASVVLIAPFGTGMVLIFLAAQSYLIDVYLKYAASALAANSLLRSLFGFAFPLFAGQMYTGLGVQWASTVVAAMSLICVPIPFLFYRYGSTIRAMSKHAKTSRNLNKDKSKSKLQKAQSTRSVNKAAHNSSQHDQPDEHDNGASPGASVRSTQTDSEVAHGIELESPEPMHRPLHV